MANPIRTKRFSFIFRPLQLNKSMTLEGSIPTHQSYDADLDEHTPDYTLTPLIIQPLISVIDRDGVIPAGKVNSSLANVKWYAIVGGVRTLIATSNTGYEVTTSGDNAGRIKVKKNLDVSVPVTLEFYAQYIDPRTNQIFIIQMTQLLRCDNSTPAIPQLVLDATAQTLYNPLTDVDNQVVRARLLLGTKDSPVANRTFTWEKMRPDGSWSAVGSDILDYDLTVSADGTSCTVNRRLMGDELSLRCRARYDRNGNPSSKALDDSSPMAMAVFRRRLPKFEWDITGVPTNIPAGTKQIKPEAKIWDVNGIISNPERELMPIWYIATNKASGSLSYTQVALGMNPVIPTSAMSNEYGAVVGLDIVDTGPLKAATDSDGAVFTDSDGAILLIK